MGRPLRVEGDGSGASCTDVFARIPGVMTDHSGVAHRIIVEAPMIPNCDLPALWGRESLTKHRAVIDMIANHVVLCGSGDWRGGPPPGSWILPLHLSPSGHLLVPITHFENALQQGLDLTKDIETVRVFQYDVSEEAHSTPEWSSHIPYEPSTAVSFQHEAEIVLLTDDPREFIPSARPLTNNDTSYSLITTHDNKPTTTTRTTTTQTANNNRLDNDSDGDHSGGDGGRRRKAQK